MKYRVKSDGTTVYEQPRRWRMLRSLSKGVLWEGEPVKGQNWQHNHVWIKGYDGYVWSGALEEVDDAERPSLV
jgi:hypothetical protein